MNILLSSPSALPENLVCIICRRQLVRSEAIIGPTDLEGQATALCYQHFFNKTELILGMANFFAIKSEKKMKLELEKEFNE